MSVVVRLATEEDAAEVVDVIHAGFGARRPLDPPSTATDETQASIETALSSVGGLLAMSGSEVVGALLFKPAGSLLGMRRVAVHPSAQGTGVAAALVSHAEAFAAEHGYDGLRLAARVELPETIAFWTHLGYVETERVEPFVTMMKLLPIEMVTTSADQARELGTRLAGVLRAGDLVILNGDLGAGKTTFAQGLGTGLEVRGEITSPTFVISRVHPALAAGPALVHVDAFRLGGLAELDDLDLDMSLDTAVTVVEWGEGIAEGLSEDRLEIFMTRALGDAVLADATLAGAVLADVALAEDNDPRQLRFVPVGVRWIGSGLRAALA